MILWTEYHLAPRYAEWRQDASWGLRGLSDRQVRFGLQIFYSDLIIFGYLAVVAHPLPCLVLFRVSMVLGLRNQ